MLWQKIFLILAGLANLSLAVFILSRGRRSRVHIVFSIFLFVSALWIFATYMALYFAIELNETIANIFGRLTFAFGSLVLCAFLVFCDNFPTPGKPLKARRRVILYYGIGIIAFAFSLTHFLQKGVSIGENNVLEPDFDWGLGVWGIFMLWVVVYGLYKLISKYFRFGPGHEKAQLKYTFIGLASIGVVAILVNLLIFFFTSRTISTAPAGPAMNVIMVGLITYAIVRHRLMDLGVVFRSSVIFFAVAVILAGINLLFLLVLYQQLQLPPWVSVIFASTITVLTVLPLRNKVENFFYNRIFKMQKYEKIVEEISNDLTSIMDLNGLCKIVVDKLVDILRLENGSLLLLDKPGQGYSMLYSSKSGRETRPEKRLDSANILARKLALSGKILLLDELKRTLTEEQYGLYAQEFAALESVALVPLMIKNAMTGIISLGPKKSGDIYSFHDFNTLNLLGNHMAAALENSRLFDEILAVKNHYENILQHLRNGVITMTADQKINTINQRARNILNIGEDRLIGQPVEILGRTLAEIMIRRRTTSMDFFSEEIFLDIPGRGGVPLGIICTVMRGQKDEPGVLMVIDDLTVEKQLEAKVRRADRLASIGTLAAGMAHEIKNPLVSIKAFTQLLPERFDDRDFRDKFSNITLREVERINHIVEQLLNFARPMKPKPQLYDMHRIMDEILAVLDEELSRKSVKVIKKYTGEPVKVMIDTDQMKQVFMNLFLNSIQAMDKGGRIEIKTAITSDDSTALPRENGEPSRDAQDDSVQRHRLKVSITDSGKGVPREMLTSLFDPFFTTKTDGFGLGLAIVHGIISEHNATIEIDSEQGKWTCVTLRFPAYTES